MIRAAVACLVIFTAPALAEDLVYSNDATVQCLAEAEDVHAKRGCIGTSAGLCMKANSAGETTYGMGGCLSFELEFWDDELNRQYQIALQRAKEVDAEMRELGASVQNLEASLRAMQRAWIPYRDATCDYERAQWGGGTGGGPATLWCLMDRTGEQAILLQHSWIGG